MKTTENNHMLCEFMGKNIERLRELGHFGTACNRQSSLNSFMRFRNGNDLKVKEITSSMMEEYEAWLRERNICPNSSSFYLRNLRAVYNLAQGEPEVPWRGPFAKVFTGVEKTVKRAITMAEIKRIKRLDLCRQRHLELARDIFLFQFYCMGVSFVDAANLTRRNLAGDAIVYRRAKTGQRIQVPLSAPIQAILDRYSRAESPYLLPILSEGDAESLRRQYQTALRKTNRCLKGVARLAKIKGNLTTYVSRHSWATIARQKGVDIPTISEALGHESVQTTEIYIASIGYARIRAANARILRDL